ncbi:MAG: phage tail family protein [Clostridium sp.]|nr:phage tail family protein [Clostridium sp.]
MSEIIFNGKSSEDFKIMLVYFKPQPPSQRMVKNNVPYMNGNYDFSSLYGEQAYNERKIPCKFNLVEKDRVLLYIKYNEILNWLLTDNKEILEYTEEPGLYYIAKVENVPSWDIVSTCGILEFEFIAYPFKIGKIFEGAAIWDDFNFETDYMQQTKFDVYRSGSINIINPSSKRITPTVICSSNFDVVKDGTTYKFNKGTTKDWRFTLDKGDNNLILNGNGNIEFVFRKEVL